MKGGNMDWTFENDRPIYLQLVEKLRISIISGEYKPGERLPSVRDLAIQIKANPNTVQRALQELEEKQIIYTQRTNGKFVTQDSKLLQSLKEEIAKEKLDAFLENMEMLGIQEEKIINFIKGRKK